MENRERHNWTSDMNNEAFVRHLLRFLNIVLKFVGLAPFRYSKSRKLFVQCKCSTFLSYIIGGFILVVSLPVEFASATHFKPYRKNTVSYSIGYLHIVFTLVKIWLNQILTITDRRKLISHFNQAFHINDALTSIMCKAEHFLDDRMVGKIKFRILLFIVQSVAIVYGANAYIIRSFVHYKSDLLVRSFICFSYINAIFVTTIYLGGSLMLCERYCQLLYRRIEEVFSDINVTTKSNKCQDNLKLNEQFSEILKAYDVIVMFISNSHYLFASHVVICACSTFLVSLHGAFTLYCSVRIGEQIQTNKLIVDFLITACYIQFQFIEFTCIISLSSSVKKKIARLHFLVQRTPFCGIDGLLIERINLLSIQMQQVKPTYTFCGLFAFDKQFFLSIVVTMISYLIILIQFDIAAVDSKVSG